MASARLQQTVSLDVAVDHRIRKLFRPVPRPHDRSSHSKHVSLIKHRGRYLGVEDDEIQVTAQLAGPALTGGIVVVLQQPRQNHPFENASCHTLDIVPDISIIDLLPYIPEQDMENMNHADMCDAFQRTVGLFSSKKPAIVFCAGQLRLDSWNGCKGDMRELESIGIAHTFNDPSVKLWDRNYGTVEVHRVNGFHPSTAMNYFPEYSCLRQLLLLEVAQTCALLSGNWEEEAWMHEFRTFCKESFNHKIGNMANALYHGLIASRLSDHCNDANLILRRLSELVDGIRPQWVDNRREKILMAAHETSVLVRHPWGIQGWFNNTSLRSMILDHMKSLGECTNSTGGKPSLDVIQGSIVFLRMAEAVEAILWDLIQDKSDGGTEVGIHEREVIIIQD